MTSISAENGAGRIRSLDGVRGVAAVIVFLSHAFFAFAPWLMEVHYPRAQAAFPDPGPVATRMQPWIPSILFSGWFAVAVFFVLSGIVLSAGTQGQQGRIVALRRAVGRYPRLMFPALASTLLACLLMLAGAMQSLPEAGRMSGSTWVADRYSFAPNFLAAAAHGAWQTFTVAADRYNPPLWTLSRELVASWILFAVLIISTRTGIRYLLIIPVVAGLYFFSDERLLLLGGCLVAGGLFAPLANNTRPVSGSILLLIGLPLSCYDFSNGMAWLRRIVDPISTALGFSEDPAQFPLTLGALFLVFGVLFLKPVARLFETRVLAWLGKHTFAIYLLHFPVLCSAGAWVYVSLHSLSPEWAAVAAVVISAIIVGLVMIPFTYFIDRQAMALGRWLGKAVIFQPRRDEAHS